MTPPLLKRAGGWGLRTFYRWRTRLVLRGCELASGAYAEGEVRVSGPGSIRIGRNAVLLDGIAPTELASGAGAEIVIGANTVLNYGARLRATSSVRIGANCLIASFVVLDDAAADFGPPAPIEIEDGVWIAHGAVIAPGVRVGRGAVVAAGSVVRRDVPAEMLAMGNPARCFSLDLVPGQKP
ncbi:acyltransferase [Blastochloris viridis]|uniref:2,3,4,5-tetrahydropyridine-2,6-dicarboxylate N-acetyltransferase n=1 Tax=Blastochloris viridis TaxID=1079 RepID=A0A0H5B768_BLAVI|nr:acyltransferase [Blastochloris viridis]ALK08698.1 Maltose O-acetyltransferase [Blastochloris viridis]BAR98007.1 2,3,4,5-tetrahydropyridine-2,6-dicarboxylate N-acetyltransferase [Blastochloris viridis]CUU41361.1 Maltose O-acetyltransferase [Blastochloris viridis]